MTTAVQLAQSVAPGVSLGFKNRIINGAMMIDQRNAGGSVSTATTNSPTYALDRWCYYVNVASKFTIQQNAGSVTPPVGFTNYIGCTSTSAYSVASGDIFMLEQRIEGLNVADLAWGTASAATVTLSFWVRSSLTGSFGGVIQNYVANRSYPFSYTISSANTWEQKSVVIPGDTAGTWLTTNGIGVLLNFSLGAGATFSGTAGVWAGANYVQPTGATSVVGTNGATFYITGVQLEVGTAATPFEFRDYGRELIMCQRYYEVLNLNASGFCLITAYLAPSDYRVTWNFKVTKRASASAALGAGATWSTSTPAIYAANDHADFYSSALFYPNGTAGNIGLQVSAEL